jgi:hypothetical protein
VRCLRALYAVVVLTLVTGCGAPGDDGVADATGPKPSDPLGDTTGSTAMTATIVVDVPVPFCDDVTAPPPPTAAADSVTDVATSTPLIDDLAQQVADAVASLPNEVPVVRTDRMVQVTFGVITSERAATLEAFRGNPRVCVRGEVGSLPTPGPQPTAGAGWRLLGDARVAGNHATALASDQTQYRFLWDAIGMPGETPPVAFETEIVIWFGHIVSSSPDCQDRLDDVVVDDAAALVQPRFSTPGGAIVCNADANPHDFVVAVQRERLPAGPFGITLFETSDRPPSTSVSADLTVPGSTATPEQLRSGEGNPSIETFGYEERTLTVGGSVAYGLPWCDGTRLGPVNRTLWVAQSDVPAAWATAPAPERLPEFEVLVRPDPPTLTLSAAGASLDYAPAGPWRGAEVEHACTPIG